MFESAFAAVRPRNEEPVHVALTFKRRAKLEEIAGTCTTLFSLKSKVYETAVGDGTLPASDRTHAAHGSKMKGAMSCSGLLPKTVYLGLTIIGFAIPAVLVPMYALEHPDNEAAGQGHHHEIQ
jgi:hypothetical protein